MLKEVAQDLDKVESLHITSDLGTDITFSTKGRRWIIADGLSKKMVYHKCLMVKYILVQ